MRKLEVEKTELISGSSQNEPNVTETKLNGFSLGVKAHEKIMLDLDKRIFDLTFCHESRTFASMCVGMKHIQPTYPIQNLVTDLLQKAVTDKYQRFVELQEICSEYGIRLASRNSARNAKAWEILDNL